MVSDPKAQLWAHEDGVKEGAPGKCRGEPGRGSEKEGVWVWIGRGCFSRQGHREALTFLDRVVPFSGSLSVFMLQRRTVLALGCEPDSRPRVFLRVIPTGVSTVVGVVVVRNGFGLLAVFPQ